MLTMEQITEILRNGFAATLRMHVPAPADHIDRIARDAANNIAMVLASEIEEATHLQRLEHESLWTKLHNAGGRGATLDIMLTSVLEDARQAFRARTELQRLVAAASDLSDAAEAPGVGGCPCCNLDEGEYLRPMRDAIIDARKELPQ